MRPFSYSFLRSSCLIALTSLMACLHGVAWGQSSADVYAEVGTTSVRLVGLGTTLPGFGELAHGSNWSLTQVWKPRIAYWRAKNSDADGRNLVDVSFIPTLQLNSAGGSWFAEAGIGAHLLSHTKINNRHFGTAFQFGEHLALGTRFGAQQQYVLAARLEHVSNGRIKQPNNGMTFAGVELSYAWR